MKEYWIHRTTSLHQSAGIVHIECEVCNWDGEDKIYLEWDAQALIDDIPALFDFAMKAREEAEKNRVKKYKEFKKKL